MGGWQCCPSVHEALDWATSVITLARQERRAKKGGGRKGGRNAVFACVSPAARLPAPAAAHLGDAARAGLALQLLLDELGHDVPGAHCVAGDALGGHLRGKMEEKSDDPEWKGRVRRQLAGDARRLLSSPPQYSRQAGGQGPPSPLRRWRPGWPQRPSFLAEPRARVFS